MNDFDLVDTWEKSIFEIRYISVAKTITLIIVIGNKVRICRS